MSTLRHWLREYVVPPGVTSLYRRVRREPPGFSRSPQERSLLQATGALRDRHRGQRLFIVGSGPSISRQDLKKLVGEHVMSVSNTFVHPDMVAIAPRYQIAPPIVEYHAKEVLPPDRVAWLREMEARTPSAEYFFAIGDRPMILEAGLFQGRTVHWCDYVSWDGNPNTPVDLAAIPHVGSVSEAAITVGLHLGYKNIYLLGFDHDWFNGVFNYFYDVTRDHAGRPDASRLKFADSEFQMRRHADIFRKYKYLQGLRHNIFNANANPNSYVDVFPKVDFDSLFPAPGSAR